MYFSDVSLCIFSLFSVLGSNPAVAAALSPWTRLLLPLSQGEAFTLASISYLAILVKYILAKKKKAQARWCYGTHFFHPLTFSGHPIIGPCQSSYLSLFCNFSSSWDSCSSFAGLSIRSALASLKLSNRRPCPFAALILLVSLPFLNAVALFYSDFSFLFLMTISSTTCSVAVSGHLSTLPLSAHCTCVFRLVFHTVTLAHPCFCRLVSTSLLLSSTLL